MVKLVNAKAAAVLVALLLLAGCVSETKSQSPLVWSDGSSATSSPAADAPAARPPRRSSGSDETIRIPEEVMTRLMKFVNGVQVVLSDHIEVDASRIPFQVAMVQLADPAFVETVELAAPKLKATGILMRSRVRQPMVETDYCRLRVGDGIDLVAGRDIKARYYTQVDPDRPAFLVIHAFGHASYRNPGAHERRRADSITIRAEVVRVNGQYVFRQQVR